MELNDRQTQMTEQVLSKYPIEVREQLDELVRTIPFIRNLTSPDRQYARDRPRDGKGRIIVDLARPHILENMEYFRPAARHYEKYKCYTFLRPNGNPKSEFGRWIREERRRCWEGYVRESDGEWVTGLMYWYLNYCPIMLAEADRENENVSHRKEAFPHVWDGIYWRFHYLEQARSNGEHAIELARRGASKSYSLASIMSHNLILGENAISHKRQTTILTAYQSEYLNVNGDGTFAKFIPIIDFVNEHTQFPARRLINSKGTMTWQMGYKDAITGTEKGSLNLVTGVSSKDDPDKLRGKRGYILFEEMGNFPKLDEVFKTMRFGTEEGGRTYGFMYLVGTANNKDANFTSAKELIYNPKGYNIHAIENVYDKENSAKGEIGFFFPAYIGVEGKMDRDGNSDVIASLLHILQERFTVKYNTGSPDAVLRTIADNPITPAEAMLKSGVNMFPVTAIQERLAQLETDKRILDEVVTGDLVIREGRVIYTPCDLRPIRHFPHENNKIEGAIEFFEMPQIDKETKRPYAGRYVASLDPYDDDVSTTSSLGSMFVLDLWTDRLVCEYTGRPATADLLFERCRLISIFYNAPICYEQNKKGCFAYFSKMNSLQLLCDTPQYLRDMQLVKETGFGNKAKGVNATQAINAYARGRIKDWLINKVTDVQNVDGEDVEIERFALYDIRSKALLLELASWNPDGNFDRVSSLGMLMLIREERMILTGGDVKRVVGHDPKLDDKFFSRFDKLKEKIMKKVYEWKVKR